MPSIGKDLEKIRSHLGLSIQDIQHSTKIPVSTLRSIENDSIFTHMEENHIYIRSFVRSYGRALKIADSTMIKALDQHETGNYNHLLLQDFPELQPEKRTPPPPGVEDVDTEEKDSQEADHEFRPSAEEPDPEEEQIHSEKETPYKPEEETETEEIQQQTEQKTPSAVPASLEQQKKEQADITQSPSVKSVNWADVGRKFSQEKKHTPIWIVGLIIFLIIAVLGGYFLYQNGFFDFSEITPREQIETQNETTPSSLSLDVDESATETPDEPAPVDESQETTGEADPAATQLDDILFLTVHAAYDGLGPVRIWTDIKPRMDPYWIEQGNAMRFEFRDTIRVRGPYSDLLLFKDGHLIENPEQEHLQQENDYIEITRSDFLSDPKWSTTVDFEVPEGVPAPDTVSNRPTF